LCFVERNLSSFARKSKILKRRNKNMADEYGENERTGPGAYNIPSHFGSKTVNSNHRNLPSFSFPKTKSRQASMSQSSERETYDFQKSVVSYQNTYEIKRNGGKISLKRNPNL
jgi:hypothetical protein